MPTRLLFAPATAFLCAIAVLWPGVAEEKKSNPTKTDGELVQGTWNFISVEQSGIRQSTRKRDEGFQTITFQGDKFEVKRGDKVIQAGTSRLDPSKNPRTIDLAVAEGEGQGTLQRGIYELEGDTLKTCLDLQGKKRPMEFQAREGSGNTLAILQRERKAGIDPMDPSIVYDKPHQMGSGFKAYNGKAYDKAALGVDPKVKVVLPDTGMVLEQRDQPGVMWIYMEKRAHIGAHFRRSVSIAEYRKTMGCAVKREKGALLIGTYGEFSFMEGSVSMVLLVFVPPGIEVERRPGLDVGYGGRGGQDRAPRAINPTRDEPRPALTKTKEGSPSCWLPPMVEDGWHEIPAVEDLERRPSRFSSN